MDRSQVKKLVVQVRLPRPGQKPKTVQRRVNSKREAQQVAQAIRLAYKKRVRSVSNPTVSFVLEKFQVQKAFEV